MKKGFTLAEVLITLLVIGVVAALTIPSLLPMYRKHVLETKLKKFYSLINQAIVLSEVDNGNKATWSITNINVLWDTYLKNYIKYDKVEDCKDSIPSKMVYFADGTSMRIDVYRSSNGGHLYFYPYPLAKDKICIEGSEELVFDKKSQKLYGYVFAFWPGESSLGDGAKHHTNKGVEPYRVWMGFNQAAAEGVSCSDSGTKKYCVAIIQDNGWVIPKDFPLRY